MDRDHTLKAAGNGNERPQSAAARLIEYARGHWVALPPHTTIELVEHPKAEPIPGAAYYAFGLLTWRGHRLPMIDLDALLRAYSQMQLSAIPRYALIVAYQSGPGMPVEHGALGLKELPQTVAVADGAACPLPKDSDMWPIIANSCFQFEGQAVPIIDTGRLFGSYHG